jgi:hypothetical protein
MPRFIGEHPLAKDESGKLKSRIGTVFPYSNTIVTLPGIHATQRQAYLELLDQERKAAGFPPLSGEQRTVEWDSAVDLVFEEDTILIRPDPRKMALAFQADELLQELVSKQRVKFLHVLNDKVYDAIKRRGECWRISPLPRSPEEMRRMIASSRIGIGGKEIYYFSSTTGTRLVTYQEFVQLGQLDDQSLRRHLIEIKTLAASCNRQAYPEVAFFAADKTFSKNDFAPYDFASLDASALRAAHEQLCQPFREAVPPHLRVDDVENVEWRNAMFAALLGQEDKLVSEEILLGLSSEFYMQIEWLPGARIDEGELLFDSVFDERIEDAADPEQVRQWVEKSRGFIFNLIREYGNLEYVNVGRIIGSLSYRAPYDGRRDVYIAAIKLRESVKEIIKIIRMQKWGVRERLDEGKSLLDAIVQSEEYTEYILDRRLGCRQIGMNLPPRVIARKLPERYFGKRRDYRGITIWTSYFERDYVHGIATDKMPNYKFENEEFAIRFALLLGAAAAPNMIVGRCNMERNVIFDDGDEVVVEDEHGLPIDLVVSDHTGTFTNYLQDLRVFAPDYAAPVNRRIKFVPNPEAFATAYVESFVERFYHIQDEYRKGKRAYDTLFKHRPRDPAGSFAYRWEQVLERLHRTDPRELGDVIRQHVVMPTGQAVGSRR